MYAKKLLNSEKTGAVNIYKSVFSDEDKNVRIRCDNYLTVY